MSRIKKLRHRLITASSELPDWLEPFTLPARWTWVYYRALARDKAFIRAAGMAYTTLVALVPMLLLVFSLLDAFGLREENRDAITKLIFESFLGDIPEVRDVLVPGLFEADLAALGLVGVGGLLVVAGRLYVLVEQSYNDIFGVELHRPLYMRLLLFYSALTAAPVLLTLFYLQTRQVTNDIGLSGATTVATLAVQLVVLVAPLKFFPCTPVRWGPAFLGASVSLVLLGGASWGFRQYLVLFAADDPVRVIYGSLGVLPVFLLWLYLAWVVVLLGVEVAAVSENYASMFEAEYASAYHEDRDRMVPGLDMALITAVAIARRFEEGEGPAGRDELSAATGLSPREVGVVLHALDVGGLVVRTDEGWTMARPAQQFPLADVVALWRDHGALSSSQVELQARIRRELDVGIRGSLADAVRRWDEDADATNAPRPRSMKTDDGSTGASA